MTTPLVSIITPTYNRAYCLPATIDSALGQTYQNVEVVVLDDGSSDGTRELIETRYRSEPRVRYFHQANRGVSAARNAAFGHARGEYIALLDSDDYWYPWKLELQIACMEKFRDVGMTFTDMEALDASGNVSSPRYLREGYDAYRWFTHDQLFADRVPLSTIVAGPADVIRDHSFSHGNIFSQMVMGSLVHTSTVVLRRDRLAKVGTFREEWISGEDYDFHLRTSKEGPVGFLDVSSIRYQRGRADQLTEAKYGIHLAVNFLATLDETLARDRDRIDLPPHMIHAVQAEAHAWVGEQRMRRGERTLARKHFFTALRHQPRQPRIAALLALTMLPEAAAERLRDTVRSMKRFGRRGD